MQPRFDRRRVAAADVLRSAPLARAGPVLEAGEPLTRSPPRGNIRTERWQR